MHCKVNHWFYIVVNNLCQKMPRLYNHFPRVSVSKQVVQPTPSWTTIKKYDVRHKDTMLLHTHLRLSLFYQKNRRNNKTAIFITRQHGNADARY